MVLSQALRAKAEAIAAEQKILERVFMWGPSQSGSRCPARAPIAASIGVGHSSDQWNWQHMQSSLKSTATEVTETAVSRELGSSLHAMPCYRRLKRRKANEADSEGFRRLKRFARMKVPLRNHLPPNENFS